MAPKKQGSLGPPPSAGRNNAKLPKRLLLHAEPKWGKTSFGAQFSKPIFMMTRGEDGLLTLIDSKQIESVDFLTSKPNGLDPKPTIDTWEDAKKCLSELICYDKTYDTLVIDTFNGLVQLMAESVCKRHYDGDFDKFNFYLAGDKRLSQSELPDFIELCERLRAQHQMTIVLLMHSQIKMTNNPEGENYDRWELTLAKFTKAVTERWVDAILFGGYRTFISMKSKNALKGKAEGGTQRVIHTTRTAAIDAGNRLGITDIIECGDTAEEAFTNFVSATIATSQRE